MAQWLYSGEGYNCSSCGEWIDSEIEYMLYPRQLPKHCPYCGAAMDEETGWDEKYREFCERSREQRDLRK